MVDGRRPGKSHLHLLVIVNYELLLAHDGLDVLCSGFGQVVLSKTIWQACMDAEETTYNSNHMQIQLVLWANLQLTTCLGKLN